MMKNNKVPKIRFKGFAEEWEEKELGEIALFNPKAELPEIFEYVDLESVAGTEMISHREEKKGTAPSRAQRLAKQGDLFYQTVRPYQKNNYLFEKRNANFVFSTGYAQMRPYGNGYFLLSFVQIESFVKRVLDNCTGTSYPAISSTDLSRIKAFSPDKKEQTQIGNYFQKLDTLIHKTQSKLEKLKNIKQACLEKMFPKNGSTIPEIRFKGFTGEWEEKKLGDESVTSSYSGGTPAVGVHEYYNGSIPFIRSAEINKNSTELFITDKGLENSSAKLVNIGDILYALYGATSGEVGISLLNGAINQAIMAIKPKSNYDVKFISSWLRKEKRNIINTYLQGGQGNLSSAIVKELIIRFPVYNEQQRIGNFFKNLDDLIAQNQLQLTKLKNIKKACLEKMFVNKEDTL